MADTADTLRIEPYGKSFDIIGPVYADCGGIGSNFFQNPVSALKVGDISYRHTFDGFATGRRIFSGFACGARQNH
jgi:hypothetical protein